MELIDRQALIDELCKNCGKANLEECKTDPVCATRIWLSEAPTVDAVPVVHGRYQKSEDKDEWYSYEYTCLKCGATMMVADADGNDVEPGFCAICGTLPNGGAEDG